MGTLLRRVRHAKIASPTTPKWSQAEWQRAFDAAAPHDDEDRVLFSAGNWFAAMLAYHRAQAPELSTLGLQYDELVRAAIAGVNRNWIIAQQELRIPGKPGDLVISEQLMSRRITLKPWNIEVDPDGLMEAAVDSMRHIVFASAAPVPKRASVGEILDTLLYRSMVSSGYLMLESLWKDCLWNSWAVIETKDVDIVQPTELRQAVAVAAAAFRGDTLRFSQYGNVQRSWKKLPSHRRADLADYRIVKEIRGSGRNLEIVTRRHGDGEMPGAHALHMIGVGAWLDHLIDKELPKLKPLTMRLLFAAWDFLHTLAGASERRMAQDTSVFDLAKLWSYAPAFEVGILLKSLVRALDISQPTAAALLDVLTMTSIKDVDPWLTPLWDP